MLFTSVSFLFLFLPAFLLAYQLITQGKRFHLLARIAIILGTYLFYGYENSGYLIPFWIATLMDLLWSNLLKAASNQRVRKAIVIASVVQNLSLLFLFKYLNWAANLFPNVQPLHALQAALSGPSGRVALPPGISFYLFESLSFVIDCYWRRIESPRNPLNFLTFISMFPRFIAGPIVRYSDLEKNIHDFGGTRIPAGLFVFSCGFIIKTLLADSFEKFVTLLFDPANGLLENWAAVLSYTMQLYLDFSGYSLMAIGIGMAIGFPFADNFKEPYHSKSISEFWNRWHISLSTWLRDYLYIPLGGNRTTPFRKNLNLLITMTLGGVWHGANFTFLIWGLYHGLFLILDKALLCRFRILQNRVVTLFIVMIGWVFFRADRYGQGRDIIRALFE